MAGNVTQLQPDPKLGADSPDAMEALDQESHARNQKLARLQSLEESLSKKRQEAIDARVDAGIDQRWYDDTESYEGRDELSRSYAGLRDQVQGYVDSTTGDKQKTKRSTIVVNVVRSKVNAGAARLEEITLPSDDRNWDLKPSTVPELVSELFNKNQVITHNGQPLMIQDGQTQRPVTSADLASQTIEEAKKRAQAMRDEIDDQLDQSQGGSGYEGVVRRVIHSAALLGVGIIKGPCLSTKIKKVWVPITDGKRTMHVLKYLPDRKPQSTFVDPWDFYPAKGCGDDIKKGSGTWERIHLTARDLRQMAQVDGYLKDAIIKVLMEGPRKVGEKPQKPGAFDPVTDLDVEFEAWEYHGEIDRDDLEAAGAVITKRDILSGVTGCVIMVNDTIIKADLELLDTEELPYDVFTWEKAAGTWAGYGVAWLARSAQRVITAAWRVMLDNAGQAGGPQVIMKRESVYPADDDWTITGRKLWFLDGDEEDVHNVFALHEITSNQEDFARIIELGMRFLDEETSMPMLAQGEKGTAPDLVGVANILINSANTVLRKKLKNFDDDLTIPHIGRYVDWNMQYSKKEDIKGDVEIQARASGALMERDLQNQGAANLLQLASSPAYGYGIKKWPAVRRVVQALRFDPADYVDTDAEIQKTEQRLAQQGPQIDPAVTAKNTLEKEIAQMRLEDAREEREYKKEMANRELEIRLLDMAKREKITLDQARAKLAEVVIKERGTNARFAKEAQLRETTGQGV